MILVLGVSAGCSGDAEEAPPVSGGSSTQPPAPSDPLLASFLAAREASARSTLLDVSGSDPDDLASVNERAGLSGSDGPRYVEPPADDHVCFVTGDAWLVKYSPAGAGRASRPLVALGEGSSCPARGPDPERPFPTADVLGERPRGDGGPGRWLRGGGRLAPWVPADLSDTWTADFDLGYTEGQVEAFELARVLFSALDVFAANNPGRPLPRPEELGDYEPWGFEVEDADRIEDYRVSGSTVRFCALGADGAWASVSSEDDVIATGSSGEECATS